ncbi:MAG: NAD(P)/FAD-dependent oxidoreductase [Patescibacteria group bacterium]
MKDMYDVIVIGGGPAGLAAAIRAREEGARVLLLERDAELGGILQQCIHTGFGLQVLGRELTGPEYAQHFVARAARVGVRVRLQTQVLEITPGKEVVAVSPRSGVSVFKSRAIVLAMGCRERTRAAIGIPGARCAGVYTAGTAQRLVNIHGFMPGRDCVILGSGDIGLIMARRLALEGATVRACLEIMPFTSGLQRNVVQCLRDFDIPLMLEHTIAEIHGTKRVEGVTVVRVDEKWRGIPGTERYMPCDTVLISAGLIPENELTEGLGVEMDPATQGPVLTTLMETTLPGVFACGNVAHVNDLVDNVTIESGLAGYAAAMYARGEPAGNAGAVRIRPGAGVGSVIPQRIIPCRPAGQAARLYLRVQRPMDQAVITVSHDGVTIHRLVRHHVSPGQIVSLAVTDRMLACGQGAELVIAAAAG